MKTGFSLLEILHRENPVLSRDGFAVKLFEEIVYCAELNNFAQYIFTLLQDVFLRNSAKSQMLIKTKEEFCFQKWRGVAAQVNDSLCTDWPT